MVEGAGGGGVRKVLQDAGYLTGATCLEDMMYGGGIDVSDFANDLHDL